MSRSPLDQTHRRFTEGAAKDPEHEEPERLLKLPDVSEHGVTTLYTPPAGTEVVADVVFVHGLMGHPLKTWLHGKIPNYRPPGKSGGQKKKRSISTIFGRKKNESEEVVNQKSENAVAPADPAYYFWPLHALPHDFKNIRVLAYGYDSHPTHFYRGRTNRMTITQHAQDLRNRIANERRTCRGRALIFVAHSLGGVLVKDAICQSLEMKDQPKLLDLGLSCRHIFFFGTPHLGAEIASWGEMLRCIIAAVPGGPSTYPEILRGLSPDSETMDNINRRFNDLLNDSTVPVADKIHICSFQECAGPGNARGLGGKCLQIVPDYSSKLNRNDIEQSYLVQGRDHMDMCKFADDECTAYRDFQNTLEEYLEEVCERVKSSEYQQNPAKSAKVTEFVKRLTFDDRMARQQQLSNVVTTKQTFEWIWNSDFPTWLESCEPLFWIAGHPASGKSTMMNYLSKEDRLGSILSDAHGREFLVKTFFFDFRAQEGIRNNLQGLRRSLLYQLLDTLHDLASDVRKHFGLDKRSTHEWLEDGNMMSSILEYVVTNLKKPMLLFLDGLDEYRGEKFELLHLIDELLSAGIKMCVASRDESPFSNRIKSLPHFRMDKVNRSGIKTFARTFLSNALGHTSDQEKRVVESMARLVVERSAGVFLWARFAVAAIIDAENQGFNEAALKERLEEVPSDLQAVYTRIFKSKSAKERRKSGIILRLVTSARRGILLSELFEACCLADAHIRPLREAVDDSEMQSFAKFCLAAGGGVVELLPTEEDQRYDFDAGHEKEDWSSQDSIEGKLSSDQSERGRLEQRQEIRSSVDSHGFKRETFRWDVVEVIHRSVQTFLDDEGWSILLGDEGSAEPKDLTWLKVCAAYLQQPKLVWANPSSFVFPTVLRGKLVSLSEADTWQPFEFGQQPLEGYVGEFLVEHAYEFEQGSGTSSWPLINTVMNQDFVMLHWEWCSLIGPGAGCVFGFSELSYPWLLSSGIHLAVVHKLLNFVEEAVRQNPACTEPTSDFAELALLYRSFFTDKRNLDLLQTAILYSIDFASPERSDMVTFLAAVSPRLKDPDMLIALRKAPLRDVEALLTHFPVGPLRLQSLLMDPTNQLSGRHWDEPQTLGPLWEVSRRLGGGNAKLLDLFIQRGENVNSLCGPDGTAAHSVVSNFVEQPLARIAHLDLLISRGADLKTPGRDGNVLEYYWKAVNANVGWFQYDHPSLVKYLIDHGLENRRPDPNGKVPSLETMLLFGSWHTWPDGEDYDQNYYRYGEYRPTDQAQFDDDYREAYDEHVRPRLQMIQERESVRQQTTQGVPTGLEYQT